MPLSTAFRSRVFIWLFQPGASLPTRPTTVWVGLGRNVTDAPAGVGTEISGGSYARVECTAAFGTEIDGTGSNTADLTFPAPTADWAPVGNECTHFRLYDASTGGTALTGWNPLTAPRAIVSGDPALQFTPGTLTIVVF